MKRYSMLCKKFSMFVTVTMALVSACFAADAKTSGAAKPELVVSTQWLADHLTDPHLVIVHIGHDEGDYREMHIPGAHYLAMNKFTDPHHPGTDLLPPEQLKKNLEAIGISDDSHVVYYSPDWDPMATRLFFTLDYLGHGDQTSLLDGGLDQWIREKRPVSTQDATATPGKLTVHLHPEIVAKMDGMKKLVSAPDANVVIIDARPSKRYRSGHLSGAQSMFWESALVSDKEPLLRSPQELRQGFAAAGVTGDQKVVSYCEVGLQASYTYFLARYLGFNAAMYDGSYSEWSSAKQPVVRGDLPHN